MGCRLFDRRQNTTRWLSGTLVEGAGSERQGDRGAEEDRGGDGRGTGEEVCAARSAEDRAGGAGTEGGTEVGTLAVLHEHEHDHDDGRDDLQNESDAKKKMHGG